jgi:hypothetical protein
MPTFHFFTNQASLQPQTAQQKYGPVQGNEESQYRVTSLFSSPSVQKAYAVCNGKIFAQEVNGQINLVLKPTQQAVGLLSPVKYYIYKGLKKDSLVDPNHATQIADESVSDLTAKIHKSQKERNTALDELLDNEAGTTTTLPAISAVGLNLTASAIAPATLADTALLDAVFLRVDMDEFPTVDGGDHLGEFGASVFGLEIVLDGFGEGLDMNRVRAAEVIIPATTSTNDATSKFREEDGRERILGYIDPCAFYAQFFFSGVLVKANPADAFVSKTGTALYTDVLAKFHTRNVIYLDIRNEHGHGLNYYQEYGATFDAKAQISISYDGGSPSIVDYATNHWPVFIIPTSAFTSLNSSKPATLSLTLPRGDNTSPTIYRTQGYFYTGFRRTSQPPDSTETLRANIPFAGNYTVPIAFSIPKLPDNTTLPAHVSLRYLKSVGATAANPPPASSLSLKATHFLDNLFELTYLLDGSGPRIPLNTNEVTRWHITGATAIVDASSNYGAPYVVKIGIGRDPSNVYFFACPEPTPLATGSSNKYRFLEILSRAPKTNIEFGYIRIVDANNVQQPVLTHGGLPDGIISPLDALALDIDPSTMVVLALDNDELPAVLAAVAALAPALDKRLALRNRHDYVDSNGVAYGSEYDLFVIGYSSGTMISVVQINTHIKIRHDGATPRIFSSSDAALNANSVRGSEQNRKNFARSRMQLDVDWGIRSIYFTGDTEAATSRKVQWEFAVLGKKRVYDSGEGITYDWYFVETHQDIPTNSPYPAYKILPKGSRRWVRADQNKVYPVASFEKFIIDLIALNSAIDVAQSQATMFRDTLQGRLTRIRQMTKESFENPNAIITVSISNLFDEIIGASATPPPAVKRLDDISYVGGVQETLTDDFGTQLTIDTEIQLFRDYMGVEFGPAGTGVIIDLHHLFIGLDVLFHADASKWINPFVMFDGGALSALAALPPFYPLGSNIDMSTWAGDIGAAPADFVSGADPDYRTSLVNDPTLTQQKQAELLLEHFYATRAKDDDLLPDVYAHLLYAQLLQHLQRDVNFRNLPAILYYFNAQLASEGDRAAFSRFYSYLKLDSATPFIGQHPASDNIQSGISDFTDLWWIRNNPASAATAYGSGPLIPATFRTLMAPLVITYTYQFLRWLEVHK